MLLCGKTFERGTRINKWFEILFWATKFIQAVLEFWYRDKFLIALIKALFGLRNRISSTLNV